MMAWVGSPPAKQKDATPLSPDSGGGPFFRFGPYDSTPDTVFERHPDLSGRLLQDHTTPPNSSKTLPDSDRYLRRKKRPVI